MFRCTISNDSPGQIAQPATAAAAQTASAGVKSATLSPTTASSTTTPGVGKEKEEGALEGDADLLAGRDAAAAMEVREPAIAKMFGALGGNARESACA